MDTFKLLWKGYKKPLDFSDLWKLDEKSNAHTLYDRFNDHWRPRFIDVKLLNEEKRQQNESPSDASALQPKFTKRIASILPSLWITTRKLLIISALLEVVLNLFAFAAPQILSLLIDHVTPGSMDEDWKGYFYVALLFVAVSMKTICCTYEAKLLYVTGMQLQAMLSEAVYQKSLLISNVARKESTISQLINLMSSDSQVFNDGTQYIHDLWSGPLIILLAFYFLWEQLGLAALAGMLLLLIILLINMLIFSKLKTLKERQVSKKDERIRLMNEILAGVKVLKLYAWEPAFGKRVERIRNHEISILRRVAYLTSSENFILTLAPNLVALCSFAVYVLMDETNVLTAQKAFVSIALFNMIRKPLTTLPIAFSHVVQMRCSLTRLNQFMNSDEINSDVVTHDCDENGTVIRMEEGSFSWDGRKGVETLRHINLSVKQGSLVAVVGGAGSGKSSLLSAILGEMERLSGKVNTWGPIAYVPQQVWIQNATLRDNILFGKAFDPRLYHRTIKACALELDLQILRGGDRTEICENGINLSGDLKQRIALARAVYNQADIYLFDNPMSAVDVHVGKYIFKKVFGPKGLLCNKTRIVVTHRSTYLPQVDNIIFMSDGTVSESGTYTQLLNNQGAFAEFLKEHMEPDCMQANHVSTIDVLTETDLLNQSPLERIQFYNLSRSNLVLKQRNSLEGGIPTTLLDKGMGVNKDKSKLVDTELGDDGYTQTSVFIYFLKFIGCPLVISTVALYTAAYGLSLYSTFWLSSWSKGAVNNITKETQDFYLSVYGGLTAGQAVATILANIFVTLGCLKAAKLLHNSMLGRVLRSPMSFFDATPMARIINRFSRDLDLLDKTFPVFLILWMGAGYLTMNSFLAITINSPLFLVFVVPVGIIFLAFQKFYSHTSNQLKRMESISRSLLLSQFSETLTEVSTIRAFRAQKRWVAEFEKNVDKLQMVHYPYTSTKIWSQVALEIFGNFVVLFTALLALLSMPTGGSLGLAISYALTVSFDLGVFVRQTVLLQGHLNSMERIKSYTELEQEADWDVPMTKPPAEWPQHGQITFIEFQIRYRDGLDLELRRVHCRIHPAQKIGIVGRPGAGKSLLTVGLFRLLEAARGCIEIDSKNISRLGLHDLRATLTIIPKDPVLFTGSLRFNLDPHDVYSDEALWQALENALLKTFVISLPGGLEHSFDENGNNFSVGQKQLICLARALLRKTKILIWEEATVAVDVETDDLIQFIIRNEFKYCTVLTIANRLNTIMDYDRVMVLENGVIAEFDPPETLLQISNGVFYKLAVEAGLVSSNIAGSWEKLDHKKIDCVTRGDGMPCIFHRENAK